MIKHFKTILLHNRALAIGLLVTGFFVSIMEGLGLGLVMPLLEGIKGQASSGIPFPFNRISAFFSGMNIIERVRSVALFLVIVTVLKGIALYLNTISVCRLQMVVTKYYRMKCFDQLMEVGMGYINKQKTAHLQTIGITHTEKLGALVNIVGGLVPKIFTIIVLMVMLVLLSWKLTVVSLFVVALTSILLRTIAHKAEKAGKKLTKSIKDINHAMLNVLLGMKVIRLFRREGDISKSYENEVDRVNKSMLDLVKTRRSLQPLFEISGVIGLALILIAGSFLMLSSGKGEGLAVILTFILIFFRVLPPALSFNQARVDIKGDLPYYREVHQFIETQDKPYLRNGSKVIKRLHKGIEFCAVEFGYNPHETMVLRKVSFKISKGAKVGIVGSTGCGKSTVVELLLRFYDPQRGRILIDGVDLKHLDLYSWRRCVGVVSQDTFFFHDTVRANIAFAKPNATKEEIEYAAKQAYAHNFIQELPQGYDTLVGERGALLSGGQKQRIAIARAIIMQPDVLIFDEATSALDTESEEIVQKALYEVGRDKAVITIAHRFSTIYDSDTILVLDSGKIVQQGMHKQLLQQGGLYSRLVQMQAVETQNADVLS